MQDERIITHNIANPDCFICERPGNETGTTYSIKQNIIPGVRLNAQEP